MQINYLDACMHYERPIPIVPPPPQMHSEDEIEPAYATGSQIFHTQFDVVVVLRCYFIGFYFLLLLKRKRIFFFRGKNAEKS